MKFFLTCFIVGCLIVLASALTLSYVDRKDSVKDKLLVAMEYAYFEGQKDALTDDVRIEERNGKWVWKKSPWDDSNKPAKYNPNKKIEDQLNGK